MEKCKIFEITVIKTSLLLCSMDKMWSKLVLTTHARDVEGSCLCTLYLGCVNGEVCLLLGHHCLFDAGPEAFDLVRAVVHLQRWQGKPPIFFFLINSAESFWQTVFIYKFTFLLFFTVPRGWSETFPSNKKQKWLQMWKLLVYGTGVPYVCDVCSALVKLQFYFEYWEYLFKTVVLLVLGFQTKTWFRFLQKNNRYDLFVNWCSGSVMFLCGSGSCSFWQ